METFSGTTGDFFGLAAQSDALLVYCSTRECRVCEALKPKVEELLQTEFPKIKAIDIPVNDFPEIAGQLRIFAVPTIVAYFGGNEFVRKSRTFAIDELKASLARPYGLLFS